MEVAATTTLFLMAPEGLDVEEFLARPATAHLATAGPHVRPVWFLWEEGAFWILTGPWSRVMRDVEHDRQVALVVDVSNLDTGEIKQVTARGRAELLPWDAERGRRLLRRYLGDDVSAWDNRFQRYIHLEQGCMWLRLPAKAPKLTDLSFVPSRPPG